jgi:hypothetical protein
MRVVILQSNYIPWRGYFDLVGKADTFVFFDCRQYTTADWRNRNRIKTPQGAQWLSIPCGHSTRRRIDEVRVDVHPWQADHWQRIAYNYSRAPFWHDYRDLFAELYLGRTWTHLSHFNQAAISLISREIFGFPTRFVTSSSLDGSGNRDDLLLDLCRKLGASHYLSGPSARTYLREEIFQAQGITVEWMDYAGYPTYPQLWGDFVPDVSIIDVIFNCGPQTPEMLRRNAA